MTDEHDKPAPEQSFPGSLPTTDLKFTGRSYLPSENRGQAKEEEKEEEGIITPPGGRNTMLQHQEISRSG